MKLSKALVCMLACSIHAVSAVKLKIKTQECITHHLEMYEPFYGNFVSLPDAYYHQAAYHLEITSPSGHKVHETHHATEDKFHLVPYETGRYKFCLTVVDNHHTRYSQVDRDVVWDLHIGHADNSMDHANEHDANNLWHYVHMVDSQLQQLRGSVNYMYWRERAHRTVTDSTNKKVLWYAIARATVLVMVSIAQVVGVRYLFRAK